MATKRQKQVANLIQQTLGEVFQRDSVHLFGNAIIGANYITTSPDLKFANIYVSIFNGTENTLEELQENSKKIRYFLAQRLKNNLRTVPELRFFKDDLGEYSDKMNKILNELDIPPAEQD